MAEGTADRIALDRMILLAIGALAGAATYVLVEVLPDHVENEQLLLLIAAATGGFFTAFLAATGPLSFLRAALAAAVSAIPAAGLLYWASFRFEAVEDYLETGHPPVAFVFILSVALPFLIAAQRGADGWRDYPALFTQAWNIVVRYAAAWVFTGVFWAVVFLSDALFSLVGLDVIEDLLDIDWMPFVLTGAALGLAMAVVVELSDYVSPFLILRLLRLLMPVLLVVTVVFLVALPVQGLSDLFGGLSTAATLMAMVFGIATLITSAIDRTDPEAAEAPVMRWSAQILALAMPILAGLAIHAIWLRVTAYGWTPDRLAAGAAALVLMGYALCYALAVLLRGGWMARIRGMNIAMALGGILIAALWLTPVLNPQRITAQGQVARFVRGETPVEALDLWFIKHELGHAGTAAIAQLSALDHPEAAALAARLELLEDADNRYGFEAVENAVDLPAMRTDLLANLVTLPAGHVLPQTVFDELEASQVSAVLEGCNRLTPAGHPGCVVIFADFVPEVDGDEGILIYATSSTGTALRIIRADGKADWTDAPVFLTGHRMLSLSPGSIDALHAGDFQLGPVPITVLGLGDAQILIKP